MEFTFFSEEVVPMLWRCVNASGYKQRFLEDHPLNYFSIVELAERLKIANKLSARSNSTARPAFTSNPASRSQQNQLRFAAPPWGDASLQDAAQSRGAQSGTGGFAPKRTGGFAVQNYWAVRVYKSGVEYELSCIIDVCSNL